MKMKYKFFCFIIAACLIFPAYSAPVSSTDKLAEKAVQSCSHNTLHKFDEETKTLNGVYEGNRVDALLADVAFVGDTAEVIWNGKSVTEGELQIGMIVKIYHGDLLNPYVSAAARIGPLILHSLLQLTVQCGQQQTHMDLFFP